MTDISKEDADKLVIKILKLLGGGDTLNDEQVRNGTIVAMQVFCKLVSRWPGPYQEKISHAVLRHAQYLCGARDVQRMGRLPSPDEAYRRMIAAGWLPTTSGWVRCREHYPSDDEFALGPEGKWPSPEANP